MEFCSNCGKEINTGEKFCGSCGKEQGITFADCSNCGKVLEENEKFCPVCGTPAMEISQTKAPIISQSGSHPEKEKLKKKFKKIIDEGAKNIQKQQSFFKNLPPFTKKKKSYFGRFRKGIISVFALVIVGVIIIWNLPNNTKEALNKNEINVMENGQKEIFTKTTKIQNITSEIKITEAEVVGNLNKNGIQLNIPEGTFDQNIEFNVKTSKYVIPFNSSRANLIGTPYKISINQKSKRLNKPVTIKFKLSEQEILELEHPEDLWIGYYNGKQWDYFKPLEVNIKDKFVKFDTYHFSPYAKSKLTKEERIKDFANKLAVEQWSAKNNNAPARQATEKIVQQILGKKLGLSDKSITQDIVESIMNESDYQKLLVSYNDNKMDQFGTDLAILAGKTIVKVVTEDSNAKALLGSVTTHASKINTGINIARSLADGNLEQAAKDVSNEIIGTFPMTKLFSEAAKNIDKQIVRWRDQELEAAYKVFTNGSESSIPFWGYSVEPGNFDEVWLQMKGLKPQLLRDAKQKYALAHNMKVDDLGPRVLEIIEDQTKENLRNKFKGRAKEEKEIDKLKAENIKLIKVFDKYKLLNRRYFGYHEQSSLELRLHRLYKIKDMILKDTKCRIEYYGGAEDGIIRAKIVAKLIQIWYNSDNGHQKYREELIKLGYLKKVEQVNELPKSGIKNMNTKTKIEEPLNLDGIDGIVDIEEENTETDNTGSNTGSWVLSETLIEKGTVTTNKCYVGSMSLSNGSFSFSKACVVGRCNIKEREYSILEANGSWSPPSSILKPDKEYPMNSSINRSSKVYEYYSFDAGITIYMDYFDTKCGYSRNRIKISEGLKVSNGGGKTSYSWSGTFKAPNFGFAESRETNKFQIKVSTSSGCVHYIYTWKK